MPKNGLVFVLVCIAYVHGMCNRIEFSDATKSNMRNLHNNHRSIVARGQEAKHPYKAVGMKRLIWDDALAQRASDCAATCPSGHCAGDDGENISRLNVGFAPEDLPFQATQQWSKEVDEIPNTFSKGMFPLDNTSEIFNKIGHWTQMIWANTRRIGCGAAEDDKIIYVVCRYDTGNQNRYVYNPASGSLFLEETAANLRTLNQCGSDCTDNLNF